MQAKTTRAFRTISEAGEELELQPHVLRFWESKFTDIKPIKRGGGRRFYRPEDIEFLRGIKVLLHVEKHPIKDVQKLIKKSGASRIVELGRSIEKASNDRDISETTLVPDRISPSDECENETGQAMPYQSAEKISLQPTEKESDHTPDISEDAVLTLRHRSSEDSVAPILETSRDAADAQVSAPLPSAARSDPILKPSIDRASIEASLAKLEALQARWVKFSSGNGRN